LGFGVWGLGFGVWGLGFEILSLGFGVRGLGFGVWGLGLILLGRRVFCFRIYSSGLSAYALGLTNRLIFPPRHLRGTTVRRTLWALSGHSMTVLKSRAAAIVAVSIGLKETCLRLQNRTRDL
jgi:hypothetical protein